MCPNKDCCGDGGNKFIEVPNDGSVFTRIINNQNSSNMFLKDDVCSWVIKNPVSMGHADWMWV